MIILRQRTFSKKHSTDEKDDKLTKNKAIGIGAIGAGVTMTPAAAEELKKGIDSTEGELTGRLKRYHNTKSEYVDSILKEGLKGEKTLDPESYTNKLLGDIASKDKRPLIYTAQNKDTADQIGLARMLTGHAPDSGKTLELHFPYEEAKRKRIFNNPEQLGLNEEDYIKEISKQQKERIKKLTNLSEKEADRAVEELRPLISQNYHIVDAKTGPTRIYEGNISPEYIKQSSKYKKGSLKEWGKYVKNNPKRFGKAAAKYVLPAAGTAALIGTGIHVYNKDKKKSKTKGES